MPSSNGLASSDEPTRLRAARHFHPRLPMNVYTPCRHQPTRELLAGGGGHGTALSQCGGGAIQCGTHLPAKSAELLERSSVDGAAFTQRETAGPLETSPPRERAGDVERGPTLLRFGESAIDQSGERGTVADAERMSEPRVRGPVSPDTAGCRRRGVWRARRGRLWSGPPSAWTPHWRGATVRRRAPSSRRRDPPTARTGSAPAPRMYSSRPASRCRRSNDGAIDRHAAPRRAVNRFTACPIAVRTVPVNRPATPGRPHAPAHES